MEWNHALNGRLLTLSLIFLAGCGQADAMAQDRANEEVRRQLGDVPAVVDTATAASLSATFRGAASRALPSVVSVQVTAQPRVAAQRGIPLPGFGQVQPRDPQPTTGMGSGFVFTSDGHIITNNHVVADAIEVTITFPDGRVYSNARVVGRDPNTDVAVVKIEPEDGEEFTPLPIADSDRVQVGDWVLALGNPLSLNFSVTAGIVSAKGRSLGIIRNQRQYGLESFIQTDAAINRGNSGGPLVDLYGRVVGVNTAIYSETGMYAGNGFAIPSSLAAKAARDIIEYGYVRRPMIGVVVAPVLEAQAELYGLDRIAGAIVTEVTPGGPAADAGIRPEDVIIAVDGEPVNDQVELTTRLARRQPGERVALTAIRDGETVRIPVRLGEFDLEAPAPTRAVARETVEERLGFAYQSLDRRWMRELEITDPIEGVVVHAVDPGSPAAGVLVPGDVILEFNRQPVSSVRDIERLAEEVERGDIVVLKLRSISSGNVAVRSYRVR